LKAARFDSSGRHRHLLEHERENAVRPREHRRNSNGSLSAPGKQNPHFQLSIVSWVGLAAEDNFHSSDV